MSEPPRTTGRGLLALCRVSNLPTVWMNVLTALVLCGAPWSGATFALLALSLSAFYCGGMALNDLCDRRFDARHQPFRPIPSGRVTLGAARGVCIALFAGGMALLGAAPHPSAVVPAFGLLLVIALYDGLHKRHAATVVLMGLCRTGVFVVAAQAAAGQVVPLVWLAGGVQLAYTIAITAVSRHEQRRGRPYGFPLIPRMIAAMALVDGAVAAVAVSPVWLVPGVAAALLTHLGQRFVRGD